VQVDAGGLCFVCQKTMQDGAPKAEAKAGGEVCLDGVARVGEANSVEGKTVIRLGTMARVYAQVYTKTSEDVQRLRHEAFTARLVDAGKAGLDDGALQSALAESDRCGKTGRTPANDQYISFRMHSFVPLWVGLPCDCFVWDAGHVMCKSVS
jgi:hypothetical protein